MTESPEEISTPNAAESPDSPGAAPAAPEPQATAATSATPEMGVSSSRPWSFTVLATVTLATVAIVVVLLARRPGASQEPATAVPATAALASRAVTPAPPPAVAENPAALPAATWTGSRKPGWATDGSRTITFQLAAESYVPVWMKRVRPVLGVRCLAGSTDVFVITESAASIEDDAGSHTVRVGFDVGADVEQRWTDSADYQALFAPDGVALARQIAESKKMRFEFTPYGAAPVVVAFDVRGFDQLVDSVATVCRWKPPRR